MDKRILSKEYRVNHLYKIVSKQGKLITFKEKEVQKQYNSNLHTRNINLKSRQHGFTTNAVIDGFDDVLFNRNFNFTLIAHTQKDAGKIFQKAKLAWKHFPLQHLYTLTKETQEELHFSHGSIMRVTTSARSDTVQRLHVSEFGKICAKYPEKAREIITGSIPAVPITGRIDIESTAEGEIGYFYDMCQEAMNKPVPTNPLEFKFFFFSWLKDKDCILDGDFSEIPKDIREYQERYKLSDQQAYFYFNQRKILKDKMKQEYPSTPEEAFEGSGKKFFPIETIKLKLENEVAPGETLGDWIHYKDYRQGHIYCLGADVSEGVGNDSSTIIIIDTTTSEVVARYKSESISPDLFAYEIKNGAERYGNCIAGVERNNHGHATLAKLKEVYKIDRIYKEHKIDTVFNTEGIKLGFHTNLATKPRIMNELKTTIEENLLRIPDRALLTEMKVYDREELNKTKADPEASNHFDILIACAISWEMRKYVVSKQQINQEQIFNQNEANYVDNPYI